MRPPINNDNESRLREGVQLAYWVADTQFQLLIKRESHKEAKLKRNQESKGLFTVFFFVFNEHTAVCCLILFFPCAPRAIYAQYHIIILIDRRGEGSFLF